MKIRQKLTLLVILPLVAVVAFAALAVFTSGREAVRAHQLRDMVEISAEAGDLTHELQAERASAVELLTGDDSDNNAENFVNQITRTDTALERYNRARAALGDPPGTTPELLDQADNNLNRLESTRDRVTDGNLASAAVAFDYRIAIADLLAYREAVPQAAGATPDVAESIRAGTVLEQAGEQASLADVSVMRALDEKELSEFHYAQMVQADSTSQDLRLEFNSLAPAQWRGWLEQSRNGPEMIEAQALNEEAISTAPGEEVSVSKAAWSERATEQRDRRAEVQDRVDDEVVAQVGQLRTEQLWWTGAQIAGVIVAVFLALFMALRLGKPVVHGLRKLSTTAHQVATEGLPKAVAQLDGDHEMLGDRTPEQFAQQAVPPIVVQGRDELAEVSTAFNEVHQEAIRIAAAQALLRVHIGAMFVRLARRGHSLAGRLTNALDEAERDEEDPNRLERLFRLDHMVTLFARSNDSLLVLGGASPAKVRRSNETVQNILTAAQGQIEQYTRVQIKTSDVEIAIKAGAVDDVVKLLAELLDNATQFSNHPVEMLCQLLADRMIIQISDQGIGTKPALLDALNKRLASQRAIDPESVQTMGLMVVSRLAARHELEVSLRPNTRGGTVAEVMVPFSLLEAPDTGEISVPEQSGRPQKRRQNAPLFETAGKTKRPKGRQEPPAKRVQAVLTGTGYDAAAVDERGLPVVSFDPIKVSATQPRSGVAQPGTAPQRQPQLFSTGRPTGEANNSRGWSAAQDAARAAQAANTDTGHLPKREPMAQLVPGAVETSTDEIKATEARDSTRDPGSVRATYQAYSRGRIGNNVSQPPLRSGDA